MTATTLTTPTRTGFDAFISYSHAADGQLAPALRQGLERLARPWQKRRALRVFHDSTGLAATPSLWATIQNALDSTRYFVLLASPMAAASPWVQQEVGYFVGRYGTARLLMVLTDGWCQWDGRRRDFDWSRSTAVPPSLAGRFAEEPLFVDLRWARYEHQVDLRNPRFRHAIGDLAAPIHGVPRDELDAIDLRQHRKATRLRRGAVAGIAALAITSTAGGVAAVVNAGQARANLQLARTREAEAVAAARVADARRLAAVSQSTASEHTDLSILLALASGKVQPTPEGSVALATAMTRPAAALGVQAGTAQGYRFALTADGQTLAHVAADNTVEVREWKTGAVKRTVTMDGEIVDDLSFDRSGTLLATVTRPGELRVTDVRRGDTPYRLPGVLRAVFNPAATQLAIVKADGTVVVRRADDWSVVWQSTVADASQVAIADTGQALVVMTTKGQVVVFDSTGERISSWWIDGDPQDIDLSGNGRVLVSGGADGAIRVFIVSDGHQSYALGGHVSGINRIQFSAGAEVIASAGDDGQVKLWDTVGKRLVGELPGNQSAILGLAFGGEGRYLWSSDGEDGTKRWDLRTGRPVRTVDEDTDGISDLSFSGDHVWLAAVVNSTVKVARSGGREDLQVLPGLTGVTQAVFLPGSSELAVATDDGLIHIVDPATGRTSRTVGALGGSVLTFAFSRDGTTMASLDADGTFRWWDVPTAQCAAPGASTARRSAWWSVRTGRVRRCRTRTGSRWSARTPRPPGAGRWTSRSRSSPSAQTAPRSSPATCTGRSPSSTPSPQWRAARSSLTGTACSAWPSAPTARCCDRRLLRRRRRGFRLDSGLRIWSTITLTKIADLVAHDDQVRAVTVSADAEYIASAGHDQRTLLWWGPAAWREQACAVAGRELTPAEIARYSVPAVAAGMC